LPDAGGWKQQDARAIYEATAAGNVYNTVKRAIAPDIDVKLSDQERDIYRYLQESGIMTEVWKAKREKRRNG
jgi:hypothetical protein